MLRPILYQEMMLGGRRGRPYLLRWLLAGWLLLQLAAVVFASLVPFATVRWDRALFGATARAYVELYVTQMFLLLALATPALAAGAVSDEKSRGTLQYLLTADLSPWEIVLGKLLGRCYQVLLLALTGLPLLCFFGVFGGLDTRMLLTVAVAAVAFVFALAGASLLASVWCRHTRDAVLCLYTVLLLGSLALGALPAWLDNLASTAYAGTAKVPPLVAGLAALLNSLNPFAALPPGWTLEPEGGLLRRALGSALAWGLLGTLCVLVASWRLRAATMRQMEGRHKNKPRWWRARRPAVGNQPLRWKERHVEGIAPLAVLRGLPRWLGLTLVFVATTSWSGGILLDHLPPQETGATLLERLLHGDGTGLLEVAVNMSPASSAFFWQGVAVMLLAGVVIGIRCSGAVTGERERQTWEALLLTPLEARELIRGKLWGIVGASYPYLLAYALPALALATLGGVGAVLWTVLWLAVTWLALFYVGSAGLWCSVRSRSSWRSLLGTLGLTYLGGFALYCVTSMLAGIVALFLVVVLMILENLNLLLPAGASVMPGVPRFSYDCYAVAFCITLAGIFILLAWMLVRSAEYRVSILERTKHWKDEPRRPLRSVRRPRGHT